MKTLKFKTNINCSNCVATAKPFLDSLPDNTTWKVDTTNPEKILTVQGEGVSTEEVVEKVKQAGFKIEEQKSLFGKLFS
ncbi:heavy-metal-associated domain-containing protein [Adhaeribacter radiodurans]|uniref:Heavy-metal-associated domain-containing protein n=1 Tax=Adhaeribacter radiodurans TaxID=2745197 RepID=A0A7L7LD26_9BACT|nr:heavy-metal-associated domain-containing protein [Adhaeribacter radiodurans]QMU30746.1 heavy-metal-associated domain-containing protein [Adhaeribacter radiodurans]